MKVRKIGIDWIQILELPAVIAFSLPFFGVVVLVTDNVIHH